MERGLVILNFGGYVCVFPKLMVFAMPYINCDLYKFSSKNYVYGFI